MQNARATLRRIEFAGYKVCVFNLPASLLGTRPAMVELQAAELDVNEPQTFVVSVPADEADAFARAAEVLAEQVRRVSSLSCGANPVRRRT